MVHSKNKKKKDHVSCLLPSQDEVMSSGPTTENCRLCRKLTTVTERERMTQEQNEDLKSHVRFLHHRMSGLKKLEISGPPLAIFETTTSTFNTFPALLCEWFRCIRLMKVNNSLHHSLNDHPIIGEIRARFKTLLDALKEGRCSPMTLYYCDGIWTIKLRQPNEWLLLQ